MSTENNNSSNVLATDAIITEEEEWTVYLYQFVLTATMISIILATIFGNILLIVSVIRHRKLRVIANYFLVSSSFADMLVGVFAMTFNASVKIFEKWIFGYFICDAWISIDIYLFTVSILHLCCTSVNHYKAIGTTLKYHVTITKKVAAFIIASIWIGSTLISFIPIFMGWYTTEQNLESKYRNLQICKFRVNKIYAVLSSSISFWIPCIIMIYTYSAICREENRQAKQLSIQTRMLPHKNNTYGDVLPNSSKTVISQNKKRSIIKMKREHKATRTLKVEIGTCIICWLPFFLWYTSTSLCTTCYCPDIIVIIVFWIGYFKSALNPFIYSYYIREFRKALKDTLQCAFCGACRHPPPDLYALDVRKASVSYDDSAGISHSETYVKHVNKRRSAIESSV